ncbi:MAG TPA: hypothetical protein DCW90_17905 [Lachnospiraceae bacterium]|nr:hypothetical protein [Lachnospiraceae bacterium]
MTKWEPFTHIVNITKPDCHGILNNSNVSITSKIDGCNSSIFYNGKNYTCASRTRTLSEEKDNAGFYKWCYSDNNEAKRLRDFCKDHENLIVFGEFTGGGSKFIGTIKAYNPKALNHMYIFDVYDWDDKRYLADDEWRPLLAAYDLDEWFVKLFGVFDHPTMEQVEEIANNNKFLLEDTDQIGEGVVIKAPGWKNCYGRECYGKLVVSEFHERKQNNKKQKQQPKEGEWEQWVVDNYLTDAELSKNLNKTCVWANVNEFDKKNGKMIGFFLQLCWKESILQEADEWVGKTKNATINFRMMNNLSNVKARCFLGF